MQSLSIHYRCRHTLSRILCEQSVTPTAPTNIFKRHRSSPASNPHRHPGYSSAPTSDRFNLRHRTPPWPLRDVLQGSSLKPHHPAEIQRWRPNPISNSFYRPEKVKPSQIRLENVVEFFERDVQRWSETPALRQRLVSFGIPQSDTAPLLQAFVFVVQSGELSNQKAFEEYRLVRFSQDLSQDGYNTSIDVIYTTILFAWASNPAHVPTLKQLISPSTIEYIQNLTLAANRFHPPDEFPEARSMHRKVIMHVGPTNSGKTHNALRALAAAQTGVYAGPLRLLAHEIWERLNLGQIVPAGVENADAEGAQVEPDSDSALDVGVKASALWKVGNPKYARLCNMITGEEQKIVDLNSGLMSCTVEMLSYARIYDVAVVDEIQMIGDGERGNGWTQAVLGLCAKELHLCGEESAVPLVRALLKDTGDELIINRYQRLTPLLVEQKSLDGDFRNIRKGDCIVTFNRSSIFALKRRIESQTSMRCAVVYGRLPPEIRSEQAALFNDPDSGYDVIIGSDAIGMGLNLKIKRIIFETVRKWDGTREQFLSVSQTKQISGRAGRYGLHGDEEPGGFVTALTEPDMDFLRRALDVAIAPLPYARIGPTRETFRALASTLPEHSSIKAIFDAHTYISMLPPNYRYTSMNKDHFARCEFIDTRGASLTIEDRILFTLLPIPWRDSFALEITARILQLHSETMNVELMTVLKTTNVMETLLQVEDQMVSKSQAKILSGDLSTLESLHKVLVMYVWMTFRQPLVYHQYAEASDLKTRVEKALDWALQSLTRNHPLRNVRSARKNITYATRSEAQKLYMFRRQQPVMTIAAAG